MSAEIQLRTKGLTHSIDKILGTHGIDEVLGTHSIDKVLGTHSIDQILGTHNEQGRNTIGE